MQLNRNNFLRWEGSFTDAVFEAVAVDDAVSIGLMDGPLEYSILDNDFATFGINLSTIDITQQGDGTNFAYWDAATQKFKFNLVTPGVKSFKYRWQDNNGNYSNEANVIVTIAARNTIWIGDGIKTCTVAFGNFTGFYTQATLIQVYEDNPAETTGLSKPNVSTDPDYVDAVFDTTLCALPDEAANWDVRFDTTWSPPLVEPGAIQVRFLDVGTSTVIYTFTGGADAITTYADEIATNFYIIEVTADPGYSPVMLRIGGSFSIATPITLNPVTGIGSAGTKLVNGNVELYY